MTWEDMYFEQRRRADGLERTVALQAMALGTPEAQRQTELANTLRRLVTLKIEARPFGFTDANDLYEPGYEDAPFGTEGFLYPLLGKDAARTVLALLNQLAQQAGTSLHALTAETTHD